MTIRQTIKNLLNQEDLNFLLTNRLPRKWLTEFMGRFSKIEQPLVRDASIAIWKYFSDLDLTEAKKSHFTSMHDCFTRELKEGARTIDMDPSVMSSPVDAFVGAHGRIEAGQLFQAKGFPYTLADLIGSGEDASAWQDGYFVTLRLSSSMYHRFHAPHDCTVERVRYFSGDTWNVNPIALKRVEKLFCKNERALLRVEVGEQKYPVALVPVAAILVASIRLHAIDTVLHTRYQGPVDLACDASYRKGEEMGWFQHGSTIIVFAPKGFTVAPGIGDGTPVRMGQALLRLP